MLAIVEGLDEEAWHRSVVPTGWTPAGLLEHLGGAEWHWFQGVVAGKQPELPGDLAEDQPPQPPDGGVHNRRALDGGRHLLPRPVRAVPGGTGDNPAFGATSGQARARWIRATDVRWVVLHMIEETARHAGHLDIARELLDGRTRLGGR